MPLIQQQKQPLLPISQLAKPDSGWMSRLPKPVGSHAVPDSDARTFLLQPWVTIRGSTASPNVITTITQDDALWCDLQRFADAAFWIDVSGSTALATGSVYLNLESSPTTDENDFRPVSPALPLVPVASANGGVVPLFTKTFRSASLAPLSRYTRWRLSATGTTGTTWDVSFRIRGVGGYTRFWTPLDIPNCRMWNRSDMGVTMDNVSRVSSWANQQGSAGIDLIQATDANKPIWTANQINGTPTLNFTAVNNQRLVSQNPYSLSTYTVAMVCTNATATGWFWTRSSFPNIADLLYTDIFCSIYCDRGTGTQSCRDVTSPASNWGTNLGAGGHSLIVQMDGTTAGHTLRVDGALRSTALHSGFGDPGTGSNTLNFTVGARDNGTTPTSTNVAEVIVYDGALQLNDLARLDEYLRRRYALY